MTRIQSLWIIQAWCVIVASWGPLEDTDDDNANVLRDDVLLLQVSHEWQPVWQAVPNAAREPGTPWRAKRRVTPWLSNSYFQEGGLRRTALMLSGSLAAVALLSALVGKFRERWADADAAVQPKKAGLEEPSEAAAAGAILRADSRASQSDTTKIGWYIMFAALCFFIYCRCLYEARLHALPPT